MVASSYRNHLKLAIQCISSKACLKQIPIILYIGIYSSMNPLKCKTVRVSFYICRWFDDNSKHKNLTKFGNMTLICLWSFQIELLIRQIQICSLICIAFIETKYRKNQFVSFNFRIVWNIVGSNPCLVTPPSVTGILCFCINEKELMQSMLLSI